MDIEGVRNLLRLATAIDPDPDSIVTKLLKQNLEQRESMLSADVRRVASADPGERLTVHHHPRAVDVALRNLN